MVQADVAALRTALEGLESRFRGLDAPVARRFRPGLSDEQVAHAEEQLTFRLSHEARCYFQWHDGVDEGDDPADWPYFPGGRILQPIALCIDSYARWVGGQSDYPGYSYQSGWLPINPMDGMSLVLDCAAAPGGASPVHFVAVKTDWELNVASSLLEAVSYWNRLIDAGYLRYDHAAGDWDWDLLDAIPTAERVRGLE